MADEPSWESIFTEQADEPRRPVPTTTSPIPTGETLSRRERKAREKAERRRRDEDTYRPKRRRRWVFPVIALVLVLAVFGGAAFAGWTLFEDRIREALGWEEPNDYAGEGSGEVTIAIVPGDVGSDVARTLAENDVVMTSEAFYDLLLEEGDVSFEAGYYLMRQKMSARAALELLTSGENRVSAAVTIPEGITVASILNRLSEGTDTPLADLEAAAADYGSYGLPAEAPNLEGYLFPATYEFDPGTAPRDMLQIMVNRMFQSLDAAGVPAEQRHQIVTKASLIQREARLTDDFYRVSRVIDNRIAQGMPLQFDSTAHYGAGSDLSSVFTTDAERADENPYNTYVIQGLPVGPISAPGDLAVDAAMHPADGSWLYFVTINLDSGETVFSDTLSQHNAAVEQLQEWCAANEC
ncbi:endolytic transglycosylase MltG [Desertivibrio insolitus]|uniref:endolytic transglycosylase MltG n=1 Tax=Herbiconiux sp. SYSU D00978 TaxID=2812562 RepID=UPI001A973D68|nr:endolytic transglycosylase MltG [Herbiconiux sp. SYSU D00978]